MGRNVIETVLGAVVLIAAAFFLTFAFKSSSFEKIDGYTVTANFSRADGLKNGSDVMLNGVKIGTVLDQNLITEVGAEQYLVRVTMSIRDDVDLPFDTMAMIANESLLGGRYMSLEVGVEEDMLPKDGSGKITQTQPPMRLDDLIGQLIYSTKSDKKTASATTSDEPNKPSLAPLPSAPVISGEGEAAPATQDAAQQPAIGIPANGAPDAVTHIDMPPEQP